MSTENKMWSLVQSLGGYFRVPKGDRLVARARLQRNDFNDDSALGRVILRGIAVSAGFQKYLTDGISQDHPIGAKILSEYEAEKGKKFTLELEVLSAIYEKYPAHDFCDALLSAKANLRGMEMSTISGDAIEVFCYKAGQTRPVSFEQSVSQMCDAVTIEAMDKIFHQICATDPIDVERVCSFAYQKALKLGETNPQCIEFAMNAGYQFMENLTDIAYIQRQSGRSYWNTSFPNKFAKFLERHGNPEEAIRCIELAIDTGLSLATAKGYPGELARLKKKRIKQ